MNLLLTRSAEDNAEMIPVIQQMKFEPLLMPLIHHQLLEFTLPEKQNIIITSKFAAKQVANLLNVANNFFVVGEESAKILATNSYAQIVAVAKNQDELKLRLNPLEHYIYLCGNHLSGGMPAYVSIKEIYHTHYLEKISSEMIEFLSHNHIDNVMLYSHNTAAQLISLLKKHNLLQSLEKSVVICLSDRIVKLFKDLNLGLAALSSANHNHNEMLLLLEKYGKRSQN